MGVQAKSLAVVLDTIGASGTGDAAVDRIIFGGIYVTLFQGGTVSMSKQRERQDVGVAWQDCDWYCIGTSYLDKVKVFVEAGQLRSHISATFPLSGVPDAVMGTMAGHFPGKVSVVP